MTRLACLSGAVVAAGMLSGALARPAYASDAVSIYVAASRVETMPSDAAATTVAIHGAFILLKADGTWEAPRCGYMHFRCPAGSETMCRMQWQDVRAIGTAATTCAGFGQRNVVTNATIRAEGTPLSSPDVWDLGLGVTTGVSVGSQCQPAKTMATACPTTTGTGGAGGAGGSGGSGGSAGAAGSGGSGGNGGSAGAGGTGAGSTGAAGTGEVLASRSACAIGAGARMSAVSALPIVALAAAATLRRRRRR